MCHKSNTYFTFYRASYSRVHLSLFIFSFRTVALLLNITYVCCPYICLLPRSGIQRRRPVLIIEFQQRPQSLIEMDSRLLPCLSLSHLYPSLSLSFCVSPLLCCSALACWEFDRFVRLVCGTCNRHAAFAFNCLANALHLQRVPQAEWRGGGKGVRG